jgi:hypothetical protein
MAAPTAIRPGLHFRLGVHHGDLQGLHYHHADMHIQYLKIEEDIGFPKVLSAKQMPEKSLEAKHIGRLRSLPQFYLGSNLDTEWSIVIPKVCTISWLTCTS